MKVPEPHPIWQKRAAGRGRSLPPPEDGGGPGEDATADGREERPPEQDIAAVHGVVADEFTPSVQEAMANLMGEVASLREALEHSHKRLDYLTQLADQDSISTLLNRRAFTRELSRVLVRARQGRIDSTLIFLEIENLKEINVRHGMAAGDAALEHVAGIVRDQFAEGIIAGRLFGAEFGLVLIGETADAARTQCERLAAALAARPLIWGGDKITLAIHWGVHSLRAGEDANAAMSTVDRVLRGFFV